METQYLSFIAGAISSLIFVTSYIPMLVKAYQTRDLHSYSSLNIILVNVGNLIYWLYIVSLPPGPVWLLHTFYTISSALLLIWYYRLRSSQFRQEETLSPRRESPKTRSSRSASPERTRRWPAVTFTPGVARGGENIPLGIHMCRTG